MPTRRVRNAFVVFAVFAGISWAGAVPAQEAGRITRVLLYPGSAAIERSARVVAGSNKVEMTGLPASFDLRTLRVEADPGIVVGEVAGHGGRPTRAPGGPEREAGN